MKLNFSGIWIRSTIGALLLAGAVILTACGGGGGGGGDNNEPPAPTTPPTTFILSAPSGTGVIFTPTLSWADASGETSYTVQVSTSETFTPLAYETTTIPANITTVTVPIENKLSVDTQYYWQVIAVNSVGQTVALNAPLTFTTLRSGELAWSQNINPSNSDDQAFVIALDSTSLYVGGYDDATTNADDEWRIEKRYLSNGSLVASFGTSTNPGVITKNPSTFPWSFDRAHAIAIDSTYMYVAGFDSIPRADWDSTDERWRIEKRLLSTGESVTTFDTDGIVTSDPSTYGTTSFSTGEDEANAIAIDSTGMYVVGYETTTAGDAVWRIEKRSLENGNLADGTNGPNFGSSGVVSENPSNADDVALAVVTDVTSTSIYVVGYDTTGSGYYEWRIEKRSKSDGTLDPTFGPGGVAFSDPSARDDAANAVAIGSTYMYIVGYETNTTLNNYQWRIEKRLLSTGESVTTFGSNGVVISDPNPGFDAAATAIAIDSAYMYVAGYDTASGYYEWRIEKRNLSDGSLVTSFGTNGAIMSYPNSIPNMDADAWSIAVDSDYIYVVGDYDYDPKNVGNSQWRIEKRAK